MAWAAVALRSFHSSSFRVDRIVPSLLGFSPGAPPDGEYNGTQAEGMGVYVSVGPRCRV